MNDNFNDQKEKLVSLNHEINLLRQQVNYLLRNEKPLGLLDLDVLMNRTHTIYDTLCTINLGENADDEELDLDPEAIAGLFGVELQEETETESEKAEPIENQDNEEVIPESFVEMPEEPEPQPIEEPIEEPVDEPTEEPADEPLEETQEEPKEELTEELTEEPIEQPIEAPAEEPIEEPTEEVKPSGDEYGFLFRFEEVPSADDFEMEKPETLGDRMMQEDHSLAARLQQNPVRDLRSVIGINDKFLFVNELFGGSMEKYNKSIDNLNDLKTFNGAMIYLNELKIELQWNSSNEAYQKLSDLVRRKFE